jgi:hypothetical protein
MLKVFALLTKRECLDTRTFIERFLDRSRTRAYVIEEHLTEEA